MEPTSNPDNSRSPRGLSRFWPVHREAEGEPGTADPPEESIALPSETQMVALGSRRGDAGGGLILPPGVPPISPYASARGPAGPANPSDGPKPLGPATPSPATPRPAAPGASGGGPAAPPGSPAAPPPAGPHEAPEGDPDRAGASESGEDAVQAVESSRNPWDRDPGALGGFGLGGRNGRLLFGGRPAADEPRPRLNGHSGPELNGRPKPPDGAPSGARRSDGDGPTVDHPAPEDAGPADPIDENGRDDMNGRAGAPGSPAAAEPTPAGNGRRDQAEPPAAEPAETAAEGRRQATGWASVPTSKHPVVTPTSGVPGSPSSGAPASPGLGAGAYGQPPTYVPALPDPAAGPVSGVPAPRASAGVAALGEPAVRPAPEVAQAAPAPAAPAEADRAEGPAPEERPRRAWDDDLAPRPPAPRRSASLEDAEPARRGRRAAPDDDDELPGPEQALRPGDVAAGQIAFWDDDATRHFRAAWHEVKAEFVDDPVRALTRAHDLLTDAVNELTEALLAERDELDPLRGTATPDTESMRMAMRGYREFLDRILAL